MHDFKRLAILQTCMTVPACLKLQYSPNRLKLRGIILFSYLWRYYLGRYIFFNCLFVRLKVWFSCFRGEAITSMVQATIFLSLGTVSLRFLGSSKLLYSIIGIPSLRYTITPATYISCSFIFQFLKANASLELENVINGQLLPTQ